MALTRGLRGRKTFLILKCSDRPGYETKPAGRGCRACITGWGEPEPGDRCGDPKRGAEPGDDGSGQGSGTGEGGTPIVNGFDTTVNAGKQGKHIVGNNNFIEGRSVFNGTVDDAQRLVDNFAGTGEWIGTNKERVNFGGKI